MAIYQRARPTRFDEVVGQDHVKEPLAAAVRRGAIGHAYLFSGPRGVGKTTTARLLAMAVNCRAVDESERPCGRCESCTLIQRGSHPDVTELDAASNNSVEDVRDLREKVRLAPLGGGTRVWILDEAHMLSRAAANALLKTLEEPPPGLLFVLATTESEKLPATVLSRCQHFRFRRLSDDEIQGKLERLVTEAGTVVDPSALALVARAADGAMRDAESLLERLLSLGRRVSREDAEEALGLPARDRLLALATALADGDLATLLGGAADLYRDGFAPRTVAEQLARTVRDALVAQVTDGAGDRLGADEDALVRALHALDDAEERFVRRGDLYALEVSLIRAHSAMAGIRPAADPSPAGAGARERAAPAAAAAPARPAAVTAPPAAAAAADRAAGGAADAPTGSPGPGPAPAATTGQTTAPARGSGAPGGAAAFSWHRVLSLAGPQLKAFLFPAEAVLDAGVLLLRYGERHAFHFNQLASREQDLYAVIDEAGGGGLGVVIEGPGGRLRRAVPRTVGPSEPERAEPAPRGPTRAESASEEPSVAEHEPATPEERATPEEPATPEERVTQHAADAGGGGTKKSVTGSPAPPTVPPAAKGGGDDDAPADLPPSDTLERLPDDFWDAPVDGRGQRAPPRAATAGARSSGSAPAPSAPAPAASAHPPAPSAAEPRTPAPRPRAASHAEPQATGDAPPGGPGLARLQSIFGGRVIAIEPHSDETATDDPEIAPVGTDPADRTG